MSKQLKLGKDGFNCFKSINSNYSMLVYTEKTQLKEATATFNHESKRLSNDNYELLMLSETEGT